MAEDDPDVPGYRHQPRGADDRLHMPDLQPQRAFFTHICHDVLHEAVDGQFADPGSPYYSPIEVHLAYDGLTLEL